MKKYILRRLLLIVPVLFGITLITFFIIHLTPGGFTKVNMQMDTRVSPDSLNRLKSLYGLDKPLRVQYINWLGRFVRLDFGQSFIDNRPVMDKVLERLPATLLLNITAMTVIFFLGVLIGVTSALYRNSVYDRWMTIFTFIGYSMPAFWLALILMLCIRGGPGLAPGIRASPRSISAAWAFWKRSAIWPRTWSCRFL